MTTVGELFEVRYGQSLELNRLIATDSQNGIAFVSRTARNNGISAYVVPLLGVELAPAGELTCALGGAVLSTFLQEQPYYTGRDVARLIPRINLNRSQLLFYCYCITANRYRYSYGRQANRTLRDIVIPSVEDLPGYVNEIDVNSFNGRNKPLVNDRTPKLNVAMWKPHQIQDLFDIRKGTRLTKAEIKPGETPFISALDNNNGFRQLIAGQPNHRAGVLTVNYNGNGVAEAFYQPRAFLASDDVNILYPRFSGMSELAGLFVCAVIRLEKYRFSYGRKWGLDRMKESVIRLPMLAEGAPDVKFMERYMATLPYSSIVEHAVAAPLVSVGI